MRFITYAATAALFCIATPAVADLRDRFVQSMQDGMDVQMLLFSRISPDVAAKLTPVEFNDEDRAVIECVVDAAEAKDMMHLFEEALEVNQKFNAAVLADESVSMATLEQHPELMAMMESQGSIGTPEEQAMMQQMNSECGTMQMMMSKMQASGLMAAMTGAASN